WPDDPEARISEKQVELLARDERFIYVPGATGTGKTVLGALLALIELSKPGHSVAIVGQMYAHVLASAAFIVQGFKNLYGSKAATIKFNEDLKKANFNMDTIWGSSCIGLTLGFQEGSNVLGRGFDLIICEEGDKIDYSVFNRN